MKKIYFTFLILHSFFALFSDNQNQENKKIKCIIYIHGTLHLSTLRENKMLAFARKFDLKDSYYYECLEKRYEDKQSVHGWHKKNCYGNQPGLQFFDREDKKLSNLPIAKLFYGLEIGYKITDPDAKCISICYNWSGILSDHERYLAGIILAIQLIALKKQLAEQYPSFDIEFTCIAHSHGGNVAGACAECSLHINALEEIKIKHLVTLGTPVLPSTTNRLKIKLFENVYFVNSEKDTTQGSDITVPGWHLSSKTLLEDIGDQSSISTVFVKIIEEKFHKIQYFTHFGLAEKDDRQDSLVPFIMFVPFLTQKNIHSIHSPIDFVIQIGETEKEEYKKRPLVTCSIDYSLYDLYKKLFDASL